jgi:hypothetical protein
MNASHRQYRNKLSLFACIAFAMVCIPKNAYAGADPTPATDTASAAAAVALAVPTTGTVPVAAGKIQTDIPSKVPSDIAALILEYYGEDDLREYLTSPENLFRLIGRESEALRVEHYNLALNNPEQFLRSVGRGHEIRLPRSPWLEKMFEQRFVHHYDRALDSWRAITGVANVSIATLISRKYKPQKLGWWALSFLLNNYSQFLEQNKANMISLPEIKHQRETELDVETQFRRSLTDPAHECTVRAVAYRAVAIPARAVAVFSCRESHLNPEFERFAPERDFKNYKVSCCILATQLTACLLCATPLAMVAGQTCGTIGGTLCVITPIGLCMPATTFEPLSAVVSRARLALEIRNIQRASSNTRATQERIEDLLFEQRAEHFREQLKALAKWQAQEDVSEDIRELQQFGDPLINGMLRFFGLAGVTDSAFN